MSSIHTQSFSQLNSITKYIVAEIFFVLNHILSCKYAEVEKKLLNFTFLPLKKMTYFPDDGGTVQG